MSEESDKRDKFSTQAEVYAKFRPGYPQELIDFLLSTVSERKAAWDCGTGNGQLATRLSPHFEKIYATDISKSQIGNASRMDNIDYRVEPAERTAFVDNFFNLITVAQAVHWFDFSKFYQEVNRTLKTDGVLAIIGYSLCKVDTGTDAVIHHFHTNILRSYWDQERKYVDAHYRNVPFPFAELPTRVIVATHDWTIDRMIGYLNSWSAVQEFIRSNNQNPIDLIVDQLRSSWEGGATKRVTFPMFVRLGKKTPQP